MHNLFPGLKSVRMRLHMRVPSMIPTYITMLRITYINVSSISCGYIQRKQENSWCKYAYYVRMCEMIA